MTQASEMERAICIHISNPTWGDRRFVPEVVQLLRTYADRLEAGQGGQGISDTLRSEQGTVLVLSCRDSSSAGTPTLCRCQSEK